MQQYEFLFEWGKKVEKEKNRLKRNEKQY